MAGFDDVISWKEKRALLERIFNLEHLGAGEIFVAAFRSLLSERYSKVVRSDARLLEGWAPVEEDQVPLRDAKIYEPAQAELLSLLHPLPHVLARATGLVVSDEGLSAARETFREHLFRAANAFEVVAVVYALMDAIEERLGSALISAFRVGRSPHSVRCTPVEPDRVFPKAPMAFGTDVVEPSNLLSPSGLLDEEVLLADVFGRLTVTPHTDGYKRIPALHVYSGSGWASRERTTWRVAMLSILADVHDVDWQSARGLFRGCALRNSRVRTRLEWALEWCDAFAPDIIVIPELNIGHELKDVLQRWLEAAPRGPDAVSPLVVYGGLHTPAPDVTAGYRNAPGLLTPAREIEWDYWKVNPVFNRADGTRENLDSSSPHVVAVDLPIGRVAVLICKDFLTADVRRTAEQLRPTLLIVPAMTTPGSVERFRNHALDFASSLRCVTLFCNSSVLLRKELAASALPEHGGPTPKRYPDGGTLGVLQVNTRLRNTPASHPLGLTRSTAVVGLYSLSTSESGLESTYEVQRLSPEQEATRAG